MKLYSVSDEYIDYLRKYESKVYDNKLSKRKHDRKYLGVVLKINNYNYFVPFSSPKKSDYINGVIRNNSTSIIRMHNGKELFGTLRLSNMIPVPKEELLYYDVSHEKDLKYKYIVLDELRFINKNSNLIKTNARSIYIQKMNNGKYNYLNNTVDFKLLESKCDLWIKKRKVNNFSFILIICFTKYF